ncbi:MAG: GDSL-type esterase/lipase family protein [Actinomycetaceae bacterium]|nr:GDSL-type esterase/lipase family protein [Actinomycetaceae bacterium]
MQAVNICVVGDELVMGSGDPRGSGWVGRAVSHTELPFGSHVHVLGRVGESTQDLSDRWEEEVLPRLERNSDNRLLVGVGAADVYSDLSTARTRLNLANILDLAMRHDLAPMVVGPPPIHCSDLNHLRQISVAASEVCQRRQIPFIDTFTPLVRHDQWLDDLALSDGTLPGQAGYGLMAWIVLHRGWYEWLDLPARQ